MSVQYRPGDLAFYLGLEPCVVMEVQRRFPGYAGPALAGGT